VDIAKFNEMPDFDRLQKLMSKMTPKQRRVIELYDGSPLYQIAARAGYKSSASSSMLWHNPVMREAIMIVRQYHLMTDGLQPSGIIKYWTDVIQDFEEETKDRLKASELLAKYYMMLRPADIKIDNREQTVQIILPDTTPPENRDEVERLKRALPETVDIDIKNQVSDNATLSDDDLKELL